MLVLGKRSWFAILFTFRGSPSSLIWKRLAITTGVALVITYLHEAYGLLHTNLTALPFTLIAVALGIFLGFRNNTSYDRFWEGRKLWGRMVNVSRSLARQILTLPVAPATHASAQPPVSGKPIAPDAHELVRLVIAYVHALRFRLRDQNDWHTLEPFGVDVATLASCTNAPVRILETLGFRFRAWQEQGYIDAYLRSTLEASLTEMTGIQGGCERIKSTPIPASYTILIHRIVAVYCFTLPFGIVNTVGVFTPLVVLMISFAFFGLDAVGDEIEDPFGTDVNDLPLLALSQTIESNLREMIGDEIPAVDAPIDNILL